MRAVLLAGGLGMRLRPYTTILPKPLVPVGDRPVMELIVRRLAAAGVTRIDVCVGHLGELIRAYFSEGTTLPDGVELRWHTEDEPLGTAGALRLVPDLDETFIAMNGDVLTTLDFEALLAAHESTLTVAMREHEVAVELGVIESEGARVTGWNEKPRLAYDVSMGVYVYEPRALEFIPEGMCQFPELVELLLAAGEPVGAYRSGADWFDIGTFPEYERAAQELERRPGLFDA